ncbi:hypothetical protein COSHB9_15900 [Companilactobacillus alimentarius]
MIVPMEISKIVLLESNLQPFHSVEKFAVDNQIIALFDVSKNNVEGNSIVFHEKYGIFTDARSTKQIMNELYEVNGWGFAMAKFLMNYFGITHHTPFINNCFAYMPMTGASRRNTDWIAIHFIELYQIETKKILFITKQGNKIWLEFPRGDFEKRIHDVCLLIQASIKVFEVFLKQGGCQLHYPPEQLFLIYSKCRCKAHNKLRLLEDLEMVCRLIIKFLLDNQGIESLGKEETEKFYLQNLERTKKLY